MEFDELFLAVVFASSLAAIVTSFGVYVINRYSAWGQKNAVHFMGFAAGMLITVSILHILPEAYSINAQAPLFVLVGYWSLHLLNHILHYYKIKEKEGVVLSIGLVPMIGIGIHSFIDGIIYSVTFNISIFTGILAAIGMVLHEFPEGIVTYLLLKRGGFSRRKAVIWSLIAAAFSTPLGTLISYPFIRTIDQAVLGLMLAFSAGALLYVGATHLIPAMEEEDGKNKLVSLALGIAAAVIIILFGE